MKTITMLVATTTLGIPQAIWADPTPQDEIEGRATYYAPGLMAQVAINRSMDLDGHLAGVALNRSGDLGRTVWIQWDDGAIDGPFLVVDCAQQGAHFERREWQGYVVEVPAWVARMRGFYGVGPAPVTVLFDPPPSVGKVLDLYSRIQ